MARAFIAGYRAGECSQRYHASGASTRLVIAPIRSGKSYTILHEALVSAWNSGNPHPVLVTAPTYGMLKSILEAPMVALAQELGLYRANNYSDHELTLKNGGKVVFRSLDVPDRVRGLTISEAFCDEVAMCSRYSVDVVRGRLLSTGGRLTLITTPMGTSNWIYEDFFADGAEDANTEIVHFDIFNNPTVTEDAVENLKTHYDPLLFRQEILGEWVNLLEHQVYHSFSRENVKDTVALPPLGYRVFVGVDYNLDKNPALLMWKDKTGKVIVYDEIWGSRTVADLGKRILERYGEQVIICDDASGQARSQGDGRTNRQMLQQLGLGNIVATRRNPPRLERYANVNAYLENARGERMLEISSKCRHLIKDLERLAYRKGSDQPDDRSGELGHASDALGYALSYIAPDAGRRFDIAPTPEQEIQSWLRG
jgi:PBSX family phage terminase large subunit